MSSPRLFPVHLFKDDHRGIYRVVHAGGAPLLLRAGHSDTGLTARFAEIGASLETLAMVGYPAPVVQRTNQYELVATDGTWTALLLTFIEGSLVTDSRLDLQGMGTMLARLHLLDTDQLRKIEPAIPFCRWHPKPKLKKWLTELDSVAHLVPAELEHRYQFCIDAVRSVLSWPNLPVALLHTDCNPQNAIRGAEGQITFIDWDGIGFGPAILDLGYLLFYCHVLQESWPVIKPNAAWIEAILHGYCRHRTLSQLEIEHLSDAIALVECHHLAVKLPDALQGDWSQDRGLTRFYDREKLVPEFAGLAAVFFQPGS